MDDFFRICKEMRIEVPDTMKYFSISESTAYYLRNMFSTGKEKCFTARISANLVELIKKRKTEKFLLPCSGIHKQEISISGKKIKYNTKKQ